MIPSRLLPVVLVVLAVGVSACGPAILDVAPRIVAPGEPIQIFGTGFSPAATASLRGSGVIQLQVISATSATIEARVPGAAPAGEPTGREVLTLWLAATAAAGGVGLGIAMPPEGCGALLLTIAK
jgi:hypothetical protein